MKFGKSELTFLRHTNNADGICPHMVSVLHLLHQAVAVDSLNLTNSCQQGFDSAKRTLLEAVMLAHPHPNAATCITTDISNFAVGPVLEQFIGTMATNLVLLEAFESRGT